MVLLKEALRKGRNFFCVETMCYADGRYNKKRIYYKV